MGNTKTFCDMVKKTADTYDDFDAGLKGGKNYTVFAPTDEAFKRYEAQLLELKPEEVYRTLLFHFNEDIIMTFEDLDCSTKLLSLTGDLSRTKCQRVSRGVYRKHQRGRGNKDIGDWPIIDINSKEACSGIIHRLDHVMLPIVFKPFKPFVVDDIQNQGTVDGVVPNLPDYTEKPTEEFTEEPTEEPTQETTKKTKKPKPTEEPTEQWTEEPTQEPTQKPSKEPTHEPTQAPTQEPTRYPYEESHDGPDNNKHESPAPTESPQGVTGTPIEAEESTKEPTKEPTKESTSDDISKPLEGSVVVEEGVTQVDEGPKIGALGINLIIFSTLLLCFVFVCMRR